MAGTIVIDTLKSSTSGPPAFQNTSGVEAGQLCRAWVNFNGVTTATIRSSFNVSSVTRSSVGNYTVNFTNAMPDANYSAVFGGIDTDTTNSWNVQVGVPLNGATASSLTVVSGVAGATADVTAVFAAIFR